MDCIYTKALYHTYRTFHQQTIQQIIGIDLGTINSVMAVIIGGESTVIPTSEGERTCPSVVAVNKNGERLVGRVARNQAITNPENTIFSIKRFMGRKFDDPEVQRDLSRIPYKVTKAPNGDVRVILGGKEYSAPEISAMILAKMKTDAEAYLGEKITQAVITVGTESITTASFFNGTKLIEFFGLLKYESIHKKSSALPHPRAPRVGPARRDGRAQHGCDQDGAL